jgi:hypothetical protein
MAATRVHPKPATHKVFLVAINRQLPPKGEKKSTPPQNPAIAPSLDREKFAYTKTGTETNL